MEALCAFPHKLARSSGLAAAFTLLVGLVFAGLASAQERQSMAAAPVALKDLIREAEENNPEIAAAERGYTAATHVAPQQSALPPTQFTIQQFSVGSPRPF